jgi:hypothetical protein
MGLFRRKMVMILPQLSMILPQLSQRIKNISEFCKFIRIELKILSTNKFIAMKYNFLSLI